MGDWIWMMIPMTALMIPIVAIFVSHQQKMTEIIHGRRHREEIEAELNGMREEIAGLRGQLTTQALALDALSRQQKTLESGQAIQQRLG